MRVGLQCLCWLSSANIAQTMTFSAVPTLGKKASYLNPFTGKHPPACHVASLGIDWSVWQKLCPLIPEHSFHVKCGR